MNIKVIDFETCGLTPDVGGVVEVGWVDMRANDEYVGLASLQGGIDLPNTLLVNPGRPIPVECRAIHHISDAMVLDAPDWETVRTKIEGSDVYCAHNAKFEQQYFATKQPWICTMKVALQLWPECPNHKAQCLRYWLGLELDPRGAMPPHRAGPDAFVAAHILRRALQEASVNDMIDWSSQARLLPRVNFGMHKGCDWNKVPTSYLIWMARTDNEDFIYTARHHLQSRGMIRPTDCVVPSEASLARLERAIRSHLARSPYLNDDHDTLEEAPLSKLIDEYNK